MRCIATFIIAILYFLPLILSAKEMTDTIYTDQSDVIILRYDIKYNEDNAAVVFLDSPRIIPGERLRKVCKGNIDRLKVIIFDRIGNLDNVRWDGVNPATFMVPANLTYKKSSNGYYVLGTSCMIRFDRRNSESSSVNLPIFIALSEKNQSFKIVRKGHVPLTIQIEKINIGNGEQQVGNTSMIPVNTFKQECEEDIDAANALSSIAMIRQLLTISDELPFSQTLQMEIYNLRSLKNKTNNQDLIDEINDVILEYTRKEALLKEKQEDDILAAEAERQALLAQEKIEKESEQKKAEEYAIQQEEKQRKRNFGMLVVGGSIAVLLFITSTVLKHLGNIRNQRSILELQQSMARQAENKARRCAKESLSSREIQNRRKTKRKTI